MFECVCVCVCVHVYVCVSVCWFEHFVFGDLSPVSSGIKRLAKDYTLLNLCKHWGDTNYFQVTPQRALLIAKFEIVFYKSSFHPYVITKSGKSPKWIKPILRGGRWVGTVFQSFIRFK